MKPTFTQALSAVEVWADFTETRKRLSVSSLRELETKLLASADKIHRGEGCDGEAVFARLRQQHKASSAREKKKVANGED
jgi:hypothetical protein